MRRDTYQHRGCLYRCTEIVVKSYSTLPADISIAQKKPSEVVYTACRVRQRGWSNGNCRSKHGRLFRFGEPNTS